MYIHLPPSAKSDLIQIYNNCLRSGSIPEDFQNVLILPILKKSKPPNLPSSYRPIALSPCIVKILETMIKNRIEHKIEERIGYIYTAFAQGKKVIAVFLDIKGAYDHVIPSVLQKDLEDACVPAAESNIILALLTQRHLFIASSSTSRILGPEKSTAMIFTRSGVVRCTPVMRLGGANIPWKKEHKYLGMMIEGNLRWRKHVEMIVGKTVSAHNTVKALCRKSWGAHSSTLIMVYKVLAAPHLDYGSLVYGRCSREILLKLDRAQYAIFRSIFSMMKSTPTNILLFESSQIPLHLRRRYKYVTKALRMLHHPVLEFMGDTSHLERLWFNGTVPPYIQAIGELSGETRVHRSHTIPIVSTPLAHILVFTDASLSSNPDSVGYGVYFPSMGIKTSGRLPDYWSIFNAELYAIGRAMSESLERNLSRVLVVSDSLSALEALKSNKFCSDADIALMRVRQLFYTASSAGHSVSCIWVPSHSYIHDNDVADRLANEGRYAESVPDISAGPQILWSGYKKYIRDLWIRDFLDLCKYKGKIYGSYVHQGNFPRVAWYSKLDKPRRFITTILRLRSGHCLTPAHLHRIGLRESPNCDCGALGDLPHIFLSCELHKEKIELMYTKLSRGASPYHLISMILYLQTT
ncbi:uncharacterized protein LOC123307066 [Coccinella septempunctata]|uniref:uncharacterized protein LOC123307066 n=1 Tax=Coccinella septempunctata TaxID=41139 RepID=UPI001D085B0B|nr:uncharacterized protein LOC123307066 [Coccinella septempunctata]